MRVSGEVLDFLKRYFVSRESASTIAEPLTPATDMGTNLGSSSRRFDTVYARVVVADSLQAGGGSSADLLDGFHAYAAPQPSSLLALDTASQFPTSVYASAVLLDGSRSMTGALTVNMGIASPPMVLNTNAQGQTVVGLKADQLNKSITAGNGLTGGGALTSSVSLSLTTPGTITATSANSSSGSHTHAIDSSIETAAAALLKWVGVTTYGFVSRAQTSISFDGVNTFTLTDTGSGWAYFRNGVYCAISGNKSVTLPGAPVANGIYYIYIDSTDGTLSQATTTWTLDLSDTKIPVATVFFNNSATPKYWVSDERHSSAYPRRVHWHEHVLEGTQVKDHALLTGYTVTPASPADTNNTFAISQASIVDEDIEHTLTALADPGGVTSDYLVFYRTGASSWMWETSPMPYRYTAAGYIQYDNAGTMTQGQNNKYYNTYLLYTNGNGASRYALIHGRGEYANLAAAQAEVPTFSMAGFGIDEYVIAYQLTWSTGNSYSTKGKCRLAASPREINVARVQTSVAAPSVDHNLLVGLQGGTSLEYYHLTSAEYTGTGSGVFARSTSPVLTTPNIGVATATSVNGNTISAGTGTLALSTFTLTVAGTASVSGTNTGDVTLATNHGLSLTGQQLAMGTPSSLTAVTTNSVTTDTHAHAITTTTTGAASTILATDLNGATKVNTLSLTSQLGVSAATYGLVFGTSYPSYIQHAANTAYPFYIFQNAYVRSPSNVETYYWGSTHANFGSRGIKFDITNGIQFYADSEASTAASSFTPTLRMALTNTGNVGIGVASPDTILHVESSGATTNFLQLEGNRNSADSEVGILFKDRSSVATGQNAARIYADRQGSLGDFDLVFHGGNQTAANLSAEILRLRGGTGRVGIGAASPSGRLHVVGIEDAPQLILTANATQTTPMLSLYDDDGVTVLSSFDSIGNLGLGATAGASKLRVHSTSTTDPAMIVRNGQSDAALGSELVTNYSFASDASGWTLGTGWAWSAGSVVHTPGNTGTLTQTLPSLTINNVYIITVLIVRTAGSFYIDVGGVPVYTFGASTAFSASTNRYFIAAATGVATLTITPTSDFAGSISSISIKQWVSESTSYINFLDSITGAQAIHIRGSNTMGNTYIGRDAGAKTSSVGGINTAVGNAALRDNLVGEGNVAVGQAAMQSNTYGYYNVAVGTGSLQLNTGGYLNSVLGHQAMYNSTTMSQSVAIGYRAAFSNQTSTASVAVGASSLYFNTGSANTAVGFNAGYQAITGSYSVWIGNNSGSSGLQNTSVFNSIALGNGSWTDASYQVRVGNGTVTDFGFHPGANLTIQTARQTATNTAGNNLALQSGGATSGATDKAAGQLILQTGVSTGTGTSQILFKTYTPAGSTGTADNVAATRMTIDHTGVDFNGVALIGASSTFQVNTTASFQTILPKATDTYDLGSSTKLWGQAYISQINATIFAEQTISLLGGWFIVGKDQGTLEADVASGATTINFGKAMTLNHFVVIKAHDASGVIKTEYIKVGAIVSGTTFTVTRDLAAAHVTDPAWTAGTVYLVLGTAGDGRIEFNAYDTPRIQILEQTDANAYGTIAERVRIGDMAGWATGVTGYGWGVGDATATDYAYYTTGSGLVVRGTIRADDGNLTNLTVDGALNVSTGGVLRSGATAYGTGAGWYMDYNAGTPRFRIGDPLGKQLTWNGTTLAITGDITSTTGAIGGWTIGATTLSATNITLDSGNKAMSIGAATTFGSDGVQLEYNAGNPRVYIGNSTNRYFKFDGTDISWEGASTSLTTAGVFTASNAVITGSVTATTGAIGGWTLASTYLGATGMRLTSGATPSVAIGATLPTSATVGTGIWIDTTGIYGLSANTQNFILNAANGNITAIAGTVGNWTLSSIAIYKDGGSATTSAGMVPADYPFYAGQTFANRATAPFRVTPAGNLTAQLGTIAGWSISAAALYKDTGVEATSSGMIPADWPFYAGAQSTNRATAPFRVSNAGALTATSATITGVVTANTGFIGGASGWTIATNKISSTGVSLTAGTTAYISFGATPPTAANTGTGVYIDKTGLYGLSANTPQITVSATDGKLTAAAGNVLLDVDGLSLKATNSYTNAVKWYSVLTGTKESSYNKIGEIIGYTNGTDSNELDVTAYARSATYGSRLLLRASDQSSNYSGIDIQAAYGATSEDSISFTYSGATKGSLNSLGWQFFAAVQASAGLLVGSGTAPSGGNVTVEVDARLGGGLYVGGVATDPATGTIEGTSTIKTGAHFLMPEIAAPSPASAITGLYSKSDHYMYYKNGTGAVEIPAFVGVISMPVNAGNATAGTFTIPASTQVPAFSMADSVFSLLKYTFRVPRGWAGKTPTIRFAFSPASTAAGNAVITTEFYRVQDGVNAPSAPASSIYTTVAMPAIGTNRVKVTTVSTAALTSFAEGDWIMFSIGRDGANVSDTYTNTVNLISWEISVVG